jgi:hypothetical protein
MKADDASALYPTNNTQSNGSPYQGMNISENNMEMEFINIAFTVIFIVSASIRQILLAGTLTST